jgi:hypothetical protein
MQLQPAPDSTTGCVKHIHIQGAPIPRLTMDNGRKTDITGTCANFGLRIITSVTRCDIPS